jgi:hypothetical protein
MKVKKTLPPVLHFSSGAPRLCLHRAHIEDSFGDCAARNALRNNRAHVAVQSGINVLLTTEATLLR